MIDQLFEFFSGLVDSTDEALPEDDTAILLAAASLMLEVARSDNSQASVELKAIEKLLADEFNAPTQRIQALVTAAASQVEAATDLYSFTQLINDQYSYADKERLVTAMWQVAYADGHIEAIESHIIRRVAGLIHLAHEDFIRLKITVRDS